jgi:hypothetical protein
MSRTSAVQLLDEGFGFVWTKVLHRVTFDFDESG